MGESDWDHSWTARKHSVAEDMFAAFVQTDQRVAGQTLAVRVAVQRIKDASVHPPPEEWRRSIMMPRFTPLNKACMAMEAQRVPV